MRLSIIALFAALIVSCGGTGKGSATSARDSLQSASDYCDSTAVTPDYGALLAQSQPYADSIMAARDQVAKLLPGLTPAQADNCYEQYSADQSRRINELFDINYVWMGEEHGVDQSDNAVFGLVVKAGLQIRGIGEGCNELAFDDYHYWNLFGKYLSPPMRDFLKLTEDEDTVLYSADAAICIPWNLLGDRVINWEKYIIKYPHGPRTSGENSAQTVYCRYMMDFLFGQDNTPTCDFDDSGTPIISDEPAAAFRKFLSSNPSSISASILRDFLRDVKGQKADADSNSFPQAFYRKVQANIDRQMGITISK